MTSTDIWNENDVLRERLRDLSARLEQEREERLKLKAENLWVKRLLQEKLESERELRAVTRIF